MATPIPAVAQQVSQVAQQQPAMKPDVAKNGASKFDQMMVDKADAGLASKQVSKVQANELLQALQKTNNTQTVQKTGKADDLKLSNATQKSSKTPPVENKSGVGKTGEVLGQMLTQVESRNVQMTKFINTAMTGKMKLNQQQLLGLQAKVAEYSLELDLTGKVVEKATTGLKDTLRTQV